MNKIGDKHLDAQQRKSTPIYSGVIRYFPRALAYVSKVSLAGNRQHHDGSDLHWDKSKSTDEADALIRHQVDHARGDLYDDDGILHIGKVAWRALAQLERHLESDRVNEEDTICGKAHNNGDEDPCPECLAIKYNI